MGGQNSTLKRYISLCFSEEDGLGFLWPICNQQFYFVCTVYLKTRDSVVPEKGLKTYWKNKCLFGHRNRANGHLTFRLTRSRQSALTDAIASVRLDFRTGRSPAWLTPSRQSGVSGLKLGFKLTFGGMSLCGAFSCPELWCVLSVFYHHVCGTQWPMWTIISLGDC